MDKGAGVDLHRKLGDTVTAGDPLYSIYAEFPADFDFAREAAEQDSGYSIGGGKHDE
jgi:thymidine phosphorylase